MVLDAFRKARNVGCFITQYADEFTLENLFGKLFKNANYTPNVILVDKCFEEINALTRVFNGKVPVHLCWVHQDRNLTRNGLLCHF